MNEKLEIRDSDVESTSFYQQPNVEQELIPVAGGIQFGIERVSNPALGIGGAYGTWGKSYDNSHLAEFVEAHLGRPLAEDEGMDLSELGFVNRQHIPELSKADHLELELEVGARLLRAAARSNGWEPSQVEGVLIGMTGPVTENYVEQIAERAGIPNSTLKVSVHKACDGSVGALNLALNPEVSPPGQPNIANELLGRKVLLGGIEGLSRILSGAHDKNALQLFGNGFGVIGVIPGKTMKFLVGKSREFFDEEGLLELHMYYPHSGKRQPGESLIEVSQTGDSHIRVAGLMHEPDEGSPIAMAGLMGMVKLFVRNGVQVVAEVFQSYQKLMEKLSMPNKQIVVAIVHHANYKINKLKEKHLLKEGISFPMPWLLKEFGNVSAASNMMAFLRQLPRLKSGDHILFDGFGAGTYYDVLVVALGN
jgi:3-oxoacyl-[acyl-carrier-protein] synthase III